MALTAAALVARLRVRLSANVDDAKLTAASLLQDVNDGLAALSEERDWPWLEALATITLVGETQAYPLPDGCTRLRLLSIGRNVIDPISYHDLVQDGTSFLGKPRQYAVVGNDVYFDPEPAAADTVAVFYQKAENVLVDDGDTTLLPDRYASLGITFAAVYSAIRLREQALLTTLLKLKDDEVQRTYDTAVRSSVAPRVTTRRDNRI